MRNILRQFIWARQSRPAGAMNFARCRRTATLPSIITVSTTIVFVVMILPSAHSGAKFEWLEQRTLARLPASGHELATPPRPPQWIAGHQETGGRRRQGRQLVQAIDGPRISSGAHLLSKRSADISINSNNYEDNDDDSSSPKPTRPPAPTGAGQPAAKSKSNELAVLEATLATPASSSLELAPQNGRPTISNETNSTDSSESMEEEPAIMFYVKTLLIILHLLVFVTGLVGNFLVCLSVYRNKSLQTITNYYIVNLAVADFLVILICLPPTVYWDVQLGWAFGLVLCKLVVYLQVSLASYRRLQSSCALVSPSVSCHKVGRERERIR